MVISDSHALISSDAVSTISEASGLVSRALADPQMAGAVSSGSFRISPVDRLGRRIDPVVFAAAEEILPLAVAHGSELLDDLAVLANLLEESAATVSRRFRSQESPQQIRKVAAYLYVCFLRKVNRVKRKQVVTVSLEEIVRSRPTWADPSAQFDMKILIDEFLAQCASDAKDMFLRQLTGHSWDEIGKSYGMSAHAAQERVRYVFQQVREKLKI